MAFRWHWDRPSRNGFSLLPLKLASHGKLVTHFTPSKALAEKKSQSYGHFPHPCPPSIKQALCFAFVAKVCFAHCSTSRLARGSPGWLVSCHQAQNTLYISLGGCSNPHIRYYWPKDDIWWEYCWCQYHQYQNCQIVSLEQLTNILLHCQVYSSLNIRFELSVLKDVIMTSFAFLNSSAVNHLPFVLELSPEQYWNFFEIKKDVSKVCDILWIHPF